MTQITLASGSFIRAQLLRQANVEFDVAKARVDETAIKESLLMEGAKPSDIADTLAEYKAQRVAVKTNGFVIGCDQILECEGQIFNKSKDRSEALQTLSSLRGKPHQLLSAAVIYEDGKPVWRKTGRAQLFMRNFSDTFLQTYLSDNIEEKLQCVGCYMLEKDGVKLFTRVQGDYYSVLGFPLLDVLEYLRVRGVVET